VTLRRKTLLIIGVMLAGLIALLYAASSAILLGGFATVEERDTHQDVQRALDALSNEIADLDSVTRDYASWDDTYAFIEDANETYPKVNLVDTTFSNLRLNLMVFVHSSGRIVFSKAFDLQNDEETPFPESLHAHLAAGSLLLQHPDLESGLTGLILLPEGALLVASRPILTSEYQGPARGTLMMGRYLNDAEIEHLAEMTHVSLTVHRFDDEQMPADFRAVSASLDKAPILVRPLSADSIAGYALIRDIYGQPALVLRVNSPRAIYQQGQTSVHYLLVSLLLVGIVFGAASLLLLEKLVLSRLARLSADVSRIGDSGGLSARVMVAGRDELSSLASVINSTLAKLEQAQYDLRKSEEQYRSLFQRSPVGVFHYDTRLYITECNDRLAAILQSSRERLIGLDMNQLKDQRIAPTLKQAIKGQAGFYEGPYRATTSPAQIWASLRTAPLLDSQNHVIGGVGIVEDITERKRAEEEIQRLNENLERRARELTALNKAGRAMTSTLNPEAVLKLVTNEIRDLLGVEGASILLRDPASDDLIFANTVGSASEQLTGVRLPVTAGIAGWVARERQSALVNDAQHDPRFFNQIDSSTGLKTRSVMAVPLMFKGALWGVAEAINKLPAGGHGQFDADDLEMLEALASSAAIAIENARLYAAEQGRAAQLARALEQQRELDRLQREFIQNVSHELRTPLGIVRGYAELLESGDLGELQLEQREPINIIARRSRMLSKLVDDIMAALELKVREVQKESVDLAHLARQAVTDLQVAASRAGLTLSAEIAQDLPLVPGDPIALRRVLDNLVGNALKFTPPGGKVTVWLQQNEDKVELQVSDTGVGIPSDHLGRIFDRFYQVDGSATRRFGGVGLGLALVKEIVEAHGGQVTVASQVGKGTTFTVLLPTHTAPSVKRDA
jgi:PAS domain S-box-containing protein